MGERRRAVCLGVAAAAIAAGIVWRVAPLGLPRFWWKYGGSLLWATMVYCLVAAAFGGRRVGRVAAVAFGVSVLVEVFKLVPGVARCFSGDVYGKAPGRKVLFRF